MPTLTALIEQKQHLETQLEDVLTYTEELEDVWNNTNLEISKKVDAYGFVIDDIKNKIEYLKDKKRKITDINQKLEAEIERIKYRLNQHCDGNKLIGNEYKMHPYMSTNNTINIGAVEPRYGSYLLPPLNFKEITTLKSMSSNEIARAHEVEDTNEELFFEQLLSKLEQAIHKCNLSDLPEGHKAIISKLVPSVRIT